MILCNRPARCRNGGAALKLPEADEATKRYKNRKPQWRGSYQWVPLGEMTPAMEGQL